MISNFVYEIFKNFEPNLSLIVFDEAVLMNDVEMLTLLIKQMLVEVDNTNFDKYDKLISDYDNIGPVYFEFKINLSLRIPLPLGFLMPSEHLKVYFQKSCVIF